MAKQTKKAETKVKRPNILIIWGDDIGQTNLSCYSKGVMGYRTPNIDRIANEGAICTDYYGEQSCTAGRSAPFAKYTTKIFSQSAAADRLSENIEFALKSQRL